ncbi:CTB family bacteriocin [Nostoc sp.]|uniref:CTB family bacteriocin n=1 Tax=Nostoc sp. TaxID=1180 RepID=UPI002FFA1FC9
MSDDEITPNDEAIELSDEELDDVAGGFNLQFTAARFHKSTRGFSQQTSRRRGHHSTRSTFHTETIDSSLFQLTITDATTEDLKVLGELFGDISALDGSA